MSFLGGDDRLFVYDELVDAVEIGRIPSNNDEQRGDEQQKSVPNEAKSGEERGGLGRWSGESGLAGVGGARGGGLVG